MGNKVGDKMETENDAKRLGSKDLERLLGVKLVIPQKTVRIDMDWDPEPNLVITFIAKIFFRALKVNKEVKEAYITTENFDEYCFPNIPTIRSLQNCSATKETEEGILKEEKLTDWDGHEKDEIKFKKELESLMKQAINPEHEKAIFEPKAFKINRKYVFKVPFPGFHKNVTKFPSDTHNISLTMEFQPISLYTNRERNLKYFELIIPPLFSKHEGKSKEVLKTESNFYFNVSVESWKRNGNIAENVLEFDIKPGTAKLLKSDTTERETYKKSVVISFTFVRHVMQTTLTLLLPIYVVLLLVPFVLFFDLSQFDEIANYLIVLLLTIIAHRQVIDDKQKSVLFLTMADMDFVFAIVFILFQMIFLFLISETGIESKFRSILFFIEEGGIVLFILWRFYILQSTYSQLTEIDVSAKVEQVSILEYLTLLMNRAAISRKIHPDLSNKIQIKSFLSLNLKILTHKPKTNKDKLLTYDTFRMHEAKDGFPTCDVFRMRIERKEAPGCLQKINKNETAYCKTLKKGYAFKIIYKIRDGPNVYPLEVQIYDSNSDSKFDPSTHDEYKQELLEEYFKKFLPADLPFNRRFIFGMFAKSFLINLLTCSFCKVIEDCRLYNITIKVMNKWYNNSKKREKESPLEDEYECDEHQDILKQKIEKWLENESCERERIF